MPKRKHLSVDSIPSSNLTEGLSKQNSKTDNAQQLLTSVNSQSFAVPIEPRFELLNKLANGDIIIETRFTHTHNHNKYLEFKDNSEAFISLSKEAIHSMVHCKGNIYHATVMGYGNKVKSHNLNKEYLAPFAKKKCLGRFYIVRCRDEQIASFLASSAFNWAECNKVTVFSPEPFASLSHASEFQGKYELYRAFRAHLRNHTLNEPIPLSKNKGVSCGVFVAYALKVAIIDRLFSKIPEEIQKKLTEIESIKQDKNVKKLHQIDAKCFDEFETLVKNNIMEIKSISGDLLNEYLKFLYIQVKGAVIADFCKYFYDFPNIFKFEGYLFLSDNQYYIMDQPAYIRLYKIYDNAYYKQENSIFLSKTMLESIMDIQPISQANKTYDKENNVINDNNFNNNNNSNKNVIEDNNNLNNNNPGQNVNIKNSTFEILKTSVNENDIKHKKIRATELASVLAADSVTRKEEDSTPKETSTEVNENTKKERNQERASESHQNKPNHH